jgi:hypothetical protein
MIKFRRYKISKYRRRARKKGQSVWEREDYARDWHLNFYWLTAIRQSDGKMSHSDARGISCRRTRRRWRGRCRLLTDGATFGRTQSDKTKIGTQAKKIEEKSLMVLSVHAVDGRLDFRFIVHISLWQKMSVIK